MTGYAKNFVENATMSFRAKNKKLLKNIVNMAKSRRVIKDIFKFS